jgi:DNA-directed RNA polymerase
MSLQSLRDFGKENIDKYQLQEHLERDCLESACEQMQEEISKFLDLSKSPNMSNIRRILCEWHMVLTKHYKAMIEDASNFSSSSSAPPSSSSGVLYSALLSSIPSEKISIIAMQELTRLSSLDVKLGGIPVTRLAMNIAENLEREIFAQQICKKEFLSYIRLNAKQRNDLLHSRRAFTRFMDKTRKVLDDNIEARQAGWIPAWNPSIKAEVGVFVINEAVKMLKFTPDRNDDDYVDAFEHQIVFSEKKRHGIVKMHPVLFELLSKDSVFNGAEPWSMPMIVSPEPWTSYNQGGYLTQRNLCVRLKDDPVHLSVLHDANANGKMDQILHGLNILGQTTWLINEPILKVAIAEWNSGINVATHERPPLERKYEFKPADSFADRKDYAKYISDWSAYLQEKEKSHSTMCDTNYKLEIARQFVGIPFYLPHSVDFRGRAYPIPPHLSHVGSDLSRGLLKFSQGFPLGERGLFWLKVQLANMYGYDK